MGYYTSYSPCGIPYFIGTDVDDVQALIARTPEQFVRDHAIEARLRHEVTAVDTDRRAVQVRDLDGGSQKWEGFDQLMIATGAAPIRPPLPGADAQGSSRCRPWTTDWRYGPPWSGTGHDGRSSSAPATSV